MPVAFLDWNGPEVNDEATDAKLGMLTFSNLWVPNEQGL